MCRPKGGIIDMLRSSGDFYQDTRFCRQCRGFVPYLRSPDGAFCAYCDHGVVLSRRKDRRGLVASIPLPESVATSRSQAVQTNGRTYGGHRSGRESRR
jgi:hypothetical protein